MYNYRWGKNDPEWKTDKYEEHSYFCPFRGEMEHNYWSKCYSIIIIFGNVPQYLDIQDTLLKHSVYAELKKAWSWNWSEQLACAARNCLLLTAFSLSLFLSSHWVTFLQEGVVLGFWNFASAIFSPTKRGEGYFQKLS